jgi:hypothetical protein
MQWSGMVPARTGTVRTFRRVEPPDEDMKDMDVDARFVAPKVLGHPRLWAGMVLANRPWKLFPSFKGAIAAAFATGAYALVTPTIWILGDASGWARLLAFMVAAIVAMVAWVIVSTTCGSGPRTGRPGTGPGSTTA